MANNYTILPCDYATLLFVNTELFRINTMMVTIFNAVVCIPTILLNLLFLTAMYRKSSLRKSSNKILASLSSSDLLSGLLVQPTIAIILLIGSIKYPLDVPCELVIFSGGLGYALACVSLLTVSFVSFDRYAAIFHPYVYNRHMSARLICCVCLFIWIFSFVVIFSLYFSKQHLAFFWINAILITFTYLWNIFVYAKIIRKVQNIQKSLKKQRERFGNVINDIQQSKGMRLAAAVILILLICYLPQIILSIWRNLPGTPLFVDSYLEYWSMTIGLLPSCLNPLVYCYYNTEIKKEIILIICYFKKPEPKTRVDNLTSRGATTLREGVSLKPLSNGSLETTDLPTYGSAVTVATENKK